MFLMNTYKKFEPVFEYGKGVYLFDTTGKKYLDLTSGIGVNSLGYGNEILTNSLKNQVDKLTHISNIFKNEYEAKASEKLIELSNMSKVFFANSGAEANEGAIKLARKYSSSKYNTKTRGTIITLKSSFHGRTLATLKATGQEKFHKNFFPFPNGFKYVERNNIENLKENLTSDVCAIMLEAIQGEGGVNPLDPNFVSEVSKLCKEHDLILIFDEVQCGIYRTGKLFGFNHFNIKPDIVTLAKGLGAGVPIGAILCSENLQDTFNPGDHGSTFGGNPLSTNAAFVALTELSKKSSLDNIKKSSLKAFELLGLNKNVKGVRGTGLMFGIETDVKSSLIQKKALDSGLLVLTAGEYTVRLLPPLTITESEIEEGILKLLNIIDELAK